VLRALQAEIAKAAAAALAKRALRDWSKGLFAEFFRALGGAGTRRLLAC
jgi:hypothetical protein